MVSQKKCVTQMMSLRTGDNSYDIPWMFYFSSSYMTICTSCIHWKLCRCWYCFYPIIFSAKYKLSMLNYFAAVIVWKTARWDYETIAEWWNSKVKRTSRFLKKSVPTKIHIPLSSSLAFIFWHSFLLRTCKTCLFHRAVIQVNKFKFGKLSTKAEVFPGESILRFIHQ